MTNDANQEYHKRKLKNNIVNYQCFINYSKFNTTDSGLLDWKRDVYRRASYCRERGVVRGNRT